MTTPSGIILMIIVKGLMHACIPLDILYRRSSWSANTSTQWNRIFLFNINLCISLLHIWVLVLEIVNEILLKIILICSLIHWGQTHNPRRFGLSRKGICVYRIHKGVILSHFRTGLGILMVSTLHSQILLLLLKTLLLGCMLLLILIQVAFLLILTQNTAVNRLSLNSSTSDLGVIECLPEGTIHFLVLLSISILLSH